MAFVLSDRVKETTATTGTGTYTLSGAATGFVTFLNGIGASNQTYYCCTDGTNWEVGYGTVSGATLTRTVVASSNSNSAVSWAAGTRDVFCTMPASKAVYKDASGNVDLGSNAGATGQFTLRRQDSVNEGGEIALCRASDNAKAWYFDAYGEHVRIFPDAVSSTGAVILQTYYSGSAANSFVCYANRTNYGYGQLGCDNSAGYNLDAIYSHSASSQWALYSGINTSSSFTGTLYYGTSTRANSTAFNLMALSTSSGANAEFSVRGDGQVFAEQNFNSGGADYAEFFEWADGNPGDEDRRGLTVVLDGAKIRPATASDPTDLIIGVISAMPVVVGDAGWNMWRGKYLRDDFGSYVLEDYEAWEWATQESDGLGGTKTVLHSYPSDAIPPLIEVPDDKVVRTQQRRRLNPAYDPNTEYVAREQRPEWSPVGLMGKLRLRKGQPVRAGWLKMRDISDTVEEWLVR